MIVVWTLVLIVLVPVGSALVGLLVDVVLHAGTGRGPQGRPHSRPEPH